MLTKKRLSEIKSSLKVHGEYGGAEPEDISRDGLAAVFALEKIREICLTVKNPAKALKGIAEIIEL